MGEEIMSRKDRVRNPKYKAQYDDYDWHKAHGICVNCGKERACHGLILCADCWEKNNIRSRKYYEKNKEKHKAQMRENGRKLYKERREKGLCTKCGKKAITGKSLCLNCYAKKRRRKDKRWKNDIPRSERPAYGMCYICAKPLNKFEKICDECHEKLSIQAKIHNSTDLMRELNKKYMDDFWRRWKK